MMIDIREPGVYVFRKFGDGVIAGFSGREFDGRYLDRFMIKLGMNACDLVMVKQEHTVDILIAEKPCLDEQIVADGIITAVKGLPCAVRTADCVPVFYWDARKKIAGIAHAGWRGSWRGICGKMVRTMGEKFGSLPADIRVAIGPANRFCCYEVGAEFREYFPNDYRFPGEGASDRKAHVDLVAAVCANLTSAGIFSEHIQDCGICTACQSSHFFSARKGDGKERIFSVIQIVE